MIRGKNTDKRVETKQVSEQVGKYRIVLTIPKTQTKGINLADYVNLQNNVDFYDKEGTLLFNISELVAKDFLNHPIHPQDDIYFGFKVVEDGIIVIHGYTYRVFFNTTNGKSAVEVPRW